MDPLTHGVAGALIARALFADGAGPAPRPATPAVAVVTLGALFPDADVVFNLFSASPVATLEYHRWVTHSLVGLPAFALALAALWRRCWGGGIGRLTGFFALGIASHIFLDLITSWGTQWWAPLSARRGAWDWVFIVDGTFTALLLLPQLLAWTYARGEGRVRRGTVSFLLMAAAAVLLQQAARLAQVPFSLRALAVTLAVLAAVLFAPQAGGHGLRVRGTTWCRAGLCAVALYLGLCSYAHARALERVMQFARANGIAVHAAGALPLPPSLLRWSGVIRTAGGVYQATFLLGEKTAPQFVFIPDRAAPDLLAAARSLREVQVYLWFARFPVVEMRTHAGVRTVVFSDRRFAQRWASAPALFEYWVVFDDSGRVTRQGWAQRLLAEPADGR
jgi:membrane-bound metal-dependent hydrolase YbcI (DUF457 family)